MKRAACAAFCCQAEKGAVKWQEAGRGNEAVRGAAPVRRVCRTALQDGTYWYARKWKQSGEEMRHAVG